MAQIHPSSLVDPQAKLAENVVVGPFCTIGPHVEVGEGTTLQSHIVLTGHTCLLYTSPSPRDRTRSRMPSSA